MEDFISRLAELRAKQIGALQEKRDAAVSARIEAEVKRQERISNGRIQMERCVELADLLRLMDVDKLVMRGANAAVCLDAMWWEGNTSAVVRLSIPTSLQKHIAYISFDVAKNEFFFGFGRGWSAFTMEVGRGRFDQVNLKVRAADLVEAVDILLHNLMLAVDAEKSILS